MRGTVEVKPRTLLDFSQGNIGSMHNTGGLENVLDGRRNILAIDVYAPFLSKLGRVVFGGYSMGLPDKNNGLRSWGPRSQRKEHPYLYHREESEKNLLKPCSDSIKGVVLGKI